jgi:hypothetical protein
VPTALGRISPILPRVGHRPDGCSRFHPADRARDPLSFLTEDARQLRVVAGVVVHGEPDLMNFCEQVTGP